MNLFMLELKSRIVQKVIKFCPHCSQQSLIRWIARIDVFIKVAIGTFAANRGGVTSELMAIDTFFLPFTKGPVNVNRKQFTASHYIKLKKIQIIYMYSVYVYIETHIVQKIVYKTLRY